MLMMHPGSRTGAADAHDARPLVATLAVAAFAKLASYSSAEPRTHRTHALGDQALPNSRADAAAADLGKRRLAHKRHVARESHIVEIGN